MNGAEALLRTLCSMGIDTCFSNPGTSEMHFVAAMDRIAGMRGIPVLAEGVATGAADGYARMARRPATTLLHCGPGLANGIANLHNARRARSPIVNLIGDLSHSHRPVDPPLVAETESLARVVSAWTRTVLEVYAVSGDGAAAVAAARAPGGAIASLILPSDVCWSEGAQVVAPRRVAAVAPTVDPSAIEQGAAWARLGPETAMLLGGEALFGSGLASAGAIARRTGARLMAESSIARIERGSGRPAVQRIPYAPAAAIQALANVKRLLLVGARSPVFSFAGPDGRSRPETSDVQVAVLAQAEDDIPDALARLASVLDCVPWSSDDAAPASDPAGGAVNPGAFAQSLAALLPEGAIVVDESVSFGRDIFPRMSGAAAHDWMQLTGGAIGSGMPMADRCSRGSPWPPDCESRSRRLRALHRSVTLDTSPRRPGRHDDHSLQSALRDLVRRDDSRGRRSIAASTGSAEP